MLLYQCATLYSVKTICITVSINVRMKKTGIKYTMSTFRRFAYMYVQVSVIIWLSSCRLSFNTVPAKNTIASDSLRASTEISLLIIYWCNQILHTLGEWCTHPLRHTVSTRPFFAAQWPGIEATVTYTVPGTPCRTPGTCWWRASWPAYWDQILETLEWNIHNTRLMQRLGTSKYDSTYMYILAVQEKLGLHG